MSNFISITEGGFEQCEPPFCPEDISISISQFECIGDIVYVTWIINDIYERNLQPSINKVFYSLNSVSTLNSSFVNASTISNPYSTYFTKPDGEGLIYIKIQVEINSTFFYVEADAPVDTESCRDDSLFSVIANVCEDYISLFGNPGYVVWVKRSGIPKTFPVFFDREEVCWYISEENWKNPSLSEEVVLNSDDIIINSINSEGAIQVNDCETCISAIQCPTEWNSDSDPLGWFYFEYITWRCRDNIIISGPSSIIWETSCVGTLRYEDGSEDDGTLSDCDNRICDNFGYEGPGLFVYSGFFRGMDTAVNAPMALNSGFGKKVCIAIRKSQLPLTIEVQEQCTDNNCDTEIGGGGWCYYIEGPGMSLARCGNSDDITGLEGSSSSSSLSSSLSSSSSSLSSSSSSLSSSSSSLSSSSVSSSSSSVSSSSSSLSSSSSSLSSSSSSLSSSSSNSSSSSGTGSGTGAEASFRLFDIDMTEEERQLTYEELIEKRVNDFYEENPDIFDDKTDEEKEEIIINIVTEGKLLTAVAIEIAIKEGLDVD